MNITMNELFKSLNKKAVIDRYISLYANDKNEYDKESIEEAFDFIINSTVKSDEIFYIELLKDYYNTSYYITCSILNLDKNSNMRISFESRSLTYNASLNITEKSNTKGYSDIDIAAHFLWEATFFGFSDEQITGIIDNIYNCDE